jgi:hypothetical protein
MDRSTRRGNRVIDVPDIPKRHPAFAEGHGEQRTTWANKRRSSIFSLRLENLIDSLINFLYDVDNYFLCEAEEIGRVSKIWRNKII